MQKLYFISGLAANKKIFSRLVLPGFEIHYLEWIMPLHNESIESYAKRMSEKIDGDDAILIGVSFGGIMVQEIARIRKVKRVIIISSIKMFEEKPMLLRIPNLNMLQKLFHVSALKKIKQPAFLFFGVKAEMEQRLLSTLIDESDDTILQWSIETFLKWKRHDYPPGIIHIHGTADTVFPIRDVKADYVIENGSHFMVYSKADEISKLLMIVLNS